MSIRNSNRSTGAASEAVPTNSGVVGKIGARSCQAAPCALALTIYFFFTTRIFSFGNDISSFGGFKLEHGGRGCIVGIVDMVDVVDAVDVLGMVGMIGIVGIAGMVDVGDIH